MIAAAADVALLVDAQGVICDGPGCPGLTAPRAVIRIAGEGDPGARILPGLIRAFADFRRLTLEVGGDATRLIDPTTGQLLAAFSFAALPVAQALPLLASDPFEGPDPAKSSAPFHTPVSGLEWARYEGGKNESRTLHAIDGVFGCIGSNCLPVRLNDLLVNRVFPA
mgnify:CR=1 FL=1